MVNRFEILKLFSDIESDMRRLKSDLMDHTNPFSELYDAELSQARDLICKAIKNLAVGVR